MTTRPSLTRRTLIQAMFYGAGASVLIACGGGSRGGAVTPAPPVDPDVPEPPVVPATQLPLSAGPLAAIGPLVQSEVDGIFIPEGFSIRRVARHLQNPRTGLPDPLGLLGYHWHVFPDGGAVFPVEDDGGWV